MTASIKFVLAAGELIQVVFFLFAWVWMQRDGLTRCLTVQLAFWFIN